MYNVSEEYKQIILEGGVRDSERKTLSFLLNGAEHLLEKDFISAKRTLKGSLYTSCMQLLEVELKGNWDLIDIEVEYKGYILKRSVSENEQSINYGTFTVIKCDYNDDTQSTILTCADAMIRAQKPYKVEDLNISFPTTARELISSIADYMELTINDYQLEYPSDDLYPDDDLYPSDITFPNDEYVISMDLWSNQSYTFRDVLSQIAQLSGTVIQIENEEMTIRKPENTGITIKENKLKKLKVGEQFGKVNILNITSEPQHYNYAFPLNWNTIPPKDRKELVFENNPILENNREELAESVFNQVNDIEYSSFVADSYGYGFFTVGDLIQVEEYFTGKTYRSMVTSEVVTHAQSMVSEVSSSKPLASQDKYVVITDQRREGQKTYLIVDQQNGKIQAVVETQEEQADKISDLEIAVDEISAKVETLAVGENLISGLNGELGLEGFTYETDPTMFSNSTLFGSETLFLSANSPILRIIETQSLSGSGIEFYRKGKALSLISRRIIPDSIYSFRVRRNLGNEAFRIYLIELNNEYAEIKRTIFNFNTPSLVEQFSFTPDEQTAYARLDFETFNTNVFSLTDAMFNRGNPTGWKESTEDVKVWARSQLEIRDDMITLNSRLIDNINGDIHNAGVNITAVGGVGIYGPMFKVMDSNRTKTLLSVETNVTGDEVINIDISNGTLGNMQLSNGTTILTTPPYERDYYQTDLSIIRTIITTGRTPTEYELYLYDINNSGTITTVDYVAINNYLLGSAVKPKNPLIQSKVVLGNNTGEILTQALFDDGKIGGETRIIDNRVSAESLEINGMTIGGKFVEVDPASGVLKVNL